MADYQVGQTVRDFISLVDVSNTPITGATFTERYNAGPTGSPFVYSITPRTNGIYEISWFADKSGDYVLQLEANDALHQLFLVEVEVSAPTPAAQPSVLVGTGWSLDTLVMDTALRLGDLLETTATEVGAGGQVWVDTLNLSAVSSKSQRGAELYVKSATNLVNAGKIARVVSSSEESSSLTLTPSLPADITPGDSGFLTNLESKGFRRQRYVQAINAGIRDISDEHLIKIQADLPGVFSYDSPYLDVDPMFVAIYRVEHNDVRGEWNEIPLAYGNTPGHNGWAWDSGRQRIVLGGDWRVFPAGYTIRISGYGVPTPLVNGSDFVDISKEWLTATAAYYLRLSMGDQRRMAEASMFKNEADALRVKAYRVLEPDTVRIR